MASKSSKKPKNSYIPIGWREWVYLPSHKNFGLKAKIDSGARSSAIHATHIKEYVKKGEDRVKFRISQAEKCLQIDTKLLSHKRITNSFGKTTTRPVIQMKIKLGNNTWMTELTLAKRARMTYPMLIGRSSLKKKHIIHSHKSYMTGVNSKSKK